MKRIVQGQNKKCKFGCIYCFTKENYYTNGQHELSEEELQDVDIIQPFSDYDVFACENSDWQNEIEYYSHYNRIISFATKAHITKNIAKELSNINSCLKLKGAFLHVGISISTIKHIKDLEPRSSSFESRIESLKILQENNIPCSVIIRPVLPTLDNDELENIVKSTYQYCDNYIYGPLYLNTDIENYLKNKGYVLEKKLHSVKWREGTPTCYIHESEQQYEAIKDCCKKYGKNAYPSNNLAVDSIKVALLKNQ